MRQIRDTQQYYGNRNVASVEDSLHKMLNRLRACAHFSPFPLRLAQNRYWLEENGTLEDSHPKFLPLG